MVGGLLLLFPDAAGFSSTPKPFQPVKCHENPALAGSALVDKARSVDVACKGLMMPGNQQSMYYSYRDFVYRRTKQPKPGIRIKLGRYGIKHKAFYRIRVGPGMKQKAKTQRAHEFIGWWNPFMALDHKFAFELKADRATYWLNRGAQPNDQVANLLDIAGIIRRTGDRASMGEWEWRIPSSSGPEAPEGWFFDGPQRVTWNNKPERIYQKRNKPRVPLKETMAKPLIERYGFQGYEKIPIDFETITEPIAGSSLLRQLDNTKLPIFDD